MPTIRQNEKDIIDALADRMWVVSSETIKDYPHLNIAETPKTSRRLNITELKRFTRLLVRFNPKAGAHYHIADWNAPDEITKYGFRIQKLH